MNLIELIERQVTAPPMGASDAVVSRRRMLSRGALLAALLGAAPRRARAGGQRGAATAHFLVNRLTMGLTESELSLADSLGYGGYLEYQLNYTAIDDSAFESQLAATHTTLAMQPYQLQPLQIGQVIGELVDATIQRSVFSPRQLYQRMVEFWTDHFNIDINNGNDRYLKTVDDRDVIRQYALTTFAQLVWASMHSPAMLYYLDNTVSVAGNPNENYARELMELHTLGVDGGYTQTDVAEVARCLTGWTMYGGGSGALLWTFRYNAGVHDNGTKVVLGTTIPPGGESEGATVHGLLVRHASTADFISRKLIRWLWGENPPQSLVDAVVAAYDRNHADVMQVGNIPNMIRAIFNSPEAGDAPAKYKRPYHLMVSGLRALGATITSTSALRSQHLAAAGHLPFAWGPPDGYPDTLDHWVGLILPRWNFGASLLNNNIAGCSVNVANFFSGLTTAQQIVDRIDARLFGGTLDPGQKDKIRNYLLPDPPTSQRRSEALGLAIAAPDFQWY